MFLSVRRIIDRCPEELPLTLKAVCPEIPPDSQPSSCGINNWHR